MTTKKHAEHHEHAAEAPKLTTEDVVKALAVLSYIHGGHDPIAEEHARAAVAQASDVIRRYGRQQMMLNDAG